MPQAIITARVSSGVHSEVLEFVLDTDAVWPIEGQLPEIEPFQRAIVERNVQRPGVEGDATGSDYFGATAPITSVEVLDVDVPSASAHDAPVPRALETLSGPPVGQTASEPAPQPDVPQSEPGPAAP